MGVCLGKIGRCIGMQVQHEKSQDEVIQALQRRVDELSAANLLLQEQLVRKEQFIAMIAHELRGPLSPIINYAQMVARPTQRTETIQRGTRIIISQARRLVRLVSLRWYVRCVILWNWPKRLWNSCVLSLRTIL